MSQTLEIKHLVIVMAFMNIVMILLIGIGMKNILISKSPVTQAPLVKNMQKIIDLIMN